MWTMVLNKLRQWMAGRYGMDKLNQVLLAGYILLAALSLPFYHRSVIGRVTLIAGYVLLLLVIVRMISKNTTKRYQENQKFLAVWNPFLGRWRIRIKHMKERKNYHFYKCSACGQRIRIPKGKGKICITCPNCKHEFIKHS